MRPIERPRAAVELTGLYLGLIVAALLSLTPFAWMVSTSLKATGQELGFPPELIPRPAVFANYLTAWDEGPFGLYARNTAIITVLATVGAVASSCTAGYAFGRLRFPGRDACFSLCVATMILPYVVTMVPTFILFKNLGWYNSWLPLIVPAWFGGSPVYIFLMRQFFVTLPPEIEDAAVVDGASTYQTLAWIMVPLALPAIATIALFSFVGHWNEFLPPLIYLQDDNLATLSLGLQRFLGTNRSAWAPMMAIATGMTLPIVTIFLLAQRFFVRGIALTGLAGR